MNLEQLEILDEIAQEFCHDQFTLLLGWNPWQIRDITEKMGGVDPNVPWVDPDELFQEVLDGELGPEGGEADNRSIRQDLEEIWDAVRTKEDWDLLQALGEHYLEAFCAEPHAGITPMTED